MKYSELTDPRQKKAFRNIHHAAGWLLGGLENTMLDSPEGSPEYESAKRKLEDHDGLVKELYEMATTDLYDEDGCEFGPGVEITLRDIRFAGKEWLMERCEARIRKGGY